MAIEIDTYNLAEVERKLCVDALREAGTIGDAADLLGITRHALKRRIVKHRIPWLTRERCFEGDLPRAGGDPEQAS